MRALLLFCTPWVVFAATITESFDSLDHAGASNTAVWNLASGKVHVPFVVDQSTGADPAVDTNEDETVSIGTGTDGAFSVATYQDFDTDGTVDSTITLDSTRIYQFTTFTLNSGYTIRATGSETLRIRVQGDMIISGIIDVAGGDGGGVSAAGSGGAAGTSCCGGGAGGQGGSSSAAATSGSGTGPGLLGSPSSSAPNGSGGGGGGAQYSGATSGAAPAGGGAGGAAGALYGNDFPLPIVAGSGGGGGGAYTLGAGNSAGAGGGGGGGALFFCVGETLTISATGQVLAGGGDGGGASDGSLRAGSGGGGAGGSVTFLIGGNMVCDGPILATFGTGGTGSGGGNGGDGAPGRTRLVYPLSAWSGSVSEAPTTNLADFGYVVYSKSAYTVASTAYDTGNSSPTYTAFTAEETKAAGDTITYAVAGSSDGFVADDSGYVASTAIATLSGKRYLKFRITIQSGDAERDASPEVRAVTVTYDEHVQDAFVFGYTGCASVHEVATHTPSLWGLFSIALALIPVGWRRLYGNPQVQSESKVE